MRLGVLFSGGKDSVYACYRALEANEVSCLITLVSKNVDSYMFHTPNVRRTDVQADALNIPQVTWHTEGWEESELEDLRSAINEAKALYGIQGVVTGAIESVYQATRVQRICRDLDLWCFNPLWQIDQLKYMRLLVDLGFSVLISGVFAYPFDESWVGAMIDDHRIDMLETLQKRYGINPSGEGGEIETFVLDCPIFKKRIEILKSSKTYEYYRGHYFIEDCRLVAK